jgi:hypothetical protein
MRLKSSSPAKTISIVSSRSSPVTGSVTKFQDNPPPSDPRVGSQFSLRYWNSPPIVGL